MEISTKGIYALETLADLAISSMNGVETIKNIAVRRNLPEKYLEQIIGKLRNAGIVTSIRGPQGGYKLSKSPNEITVFDVLEAVEHNLNNMVCELSGDNIVKFCSKCIVKNFYTGMWDEIRYVMKNVTLNDIIEQSKHNEEYSNYVYSI